MAREYFPKNCEISRGVYYQIKGLMMDLERLKKDKLDILYSAHYAITGMPHGSGVGDPTARKAERLAYIEDRLDAIGQASVLMRAERGNAVSEEFDPERAFWSYDYFNCQHKRTKESPNGPCRRTWNNFKYKFSAIVAENLNIF